MIDTKIKLSLFERVDDFYFVIADCDYSKANKLISLSRDYFKDKGHKFIVIGEEELSQKLGGEVIVMNKKSLNFFGKWKSPDELNSLASERKKIVVHFYTENNKLVNKLMNSFEHAIHVGYSNEKLTNFDISFRISDSNEKQLLDQIAKYLKQL
tara:strand:- start:101047 stop:101508 length:462 start_codon:yes stop_codon:yes gene_type:complete